MTTAAPAEPLYPGVGAASDGLPQGDDAPTAPALARIYRMYALTRAVLGVALLLAQGFAGTRGAQPGTVVLLVCVLYAVETVSLALMPRFRSLIEPRPAPAMRRLQWLLTIGFDLAAFSALHLLESASSFNFGALLVLPVLMAGVLTERLPALGTTAGVSLLLLAVAFSQTLPGGNATLPLAQAGLAGIGLFAITLLSSELSGRLAREQIVARGSLAMARQQEQLNRLVIEEMADGVLVVDPLGQVRAANPAARRLLSPNEVAPAAPFDLRGPPAWAALAEAVDQALRDGAWPDDGRDVHLRFDAAPPRTVRLRVRFTRALALGDGSAVGEPFCLLLMEDVRTAQARVRQEKLAAMGRVSAGIAHEIRNPLAAISQANALLLEDSLPPGQQRLAQMVSDNVDRLKRIVDDVMEVAPGTAAALRVIDATAEVGAAVGEWARTVHLPLGPGSVLLLEMPRRPLGVVFDPEHLRRVLVNLLDNAHRHAGDEPGAMRLRLVARDDAVALLIVGSDGPPIAPEVEPYLFEPFFSTRSRGSGLGLYICRELCQRYGAGIEFRPQPAGVRWRNQFVVALRRAALEPTDAGAQLDL